MEQQNNISFKDYVCQTTGLTNYTLASVVFKNMNNVGAQCILFDVLRYIRKKAKLEKKVFKTLGEELETLKNFQIPYPVYELTYLFKDECDKKYAKDFCEPLKEFQNTFSLYETDVREGKCKLTINAVENKINQVQCIYDFQNSNT